LDRFGVAVAVFEGAALIGADQAKGHFGNTDYIICHEYFL
jgi:hypothetical protein